MWLYIRFLWFLKTSLAYYRVDSQQAQNHLALETVFLVITYLVMCQSLLLLSLSPSSRLPLCPPFPIQVGGEVQWWQVAGWKWMPPISQLPKVTASVSLKDGLALSSLYICEVHTSFCCIWNGLDYSISLMEWISLKYGVKENPCKRMDHQDLF